MAGRDALRGAIAHGGARPSGNFEYAREWLARAGTFSIDPTGLPLGPNPIHGAALFGAMQDCGPDRWGRILIERAVRKHVLAQKPYRAIDYVLALDDTARIGAYASAFEHPLMEEAARSFR